MPANQGGTSAPFPYDRRFPWPLITPEKGETTLTFSEKLIRLRRREGLSQEALAEALGVSRQAVSRWEQGTALPDSAKLLPCARQFGVSVDWLLDDTQDWEAQRRETGGKGMNAHQQGIVRTVSGVVLGAGLTAAAALFHQNWLFLLAEVMILGGGGDMLILLKLLRCRPGS